MTQIASVYAKALYSLAKEDGLCERIRAELDAFCEAFKNEPEFLRLLSTPSISKEERLKIIDDSFGGETTPYLLNFMKILTENGYMRQFPACCEAYRSFYNEDHGIMAVKAVTAVPMSSEQITKLCAKLCKMTGKQIDLHNEIDPRCLGGVRLDYEGKQVDDTIVHRLNEIRSLLANTVL